MLLYYAWTDQAEAPAPAPIVAPQASAPIDWENLPKVQVREKEPPPPSEDALAMYRRLRKEWIANPSAALVWLGAETVYEDGRMIGLRLNPRDDHGLLEHLILRPDDVLTEVNGVTLDAPEKVALAVQTLSQEQSANLLLMRNGEQYLRTVPLP
jgi:type II secretion system protein C